MSDGRITQISYVGMLVVGIVIWYSILTNGIFTTLLPVLGITCIVGGTIRLIEYLNNNKEK